MSIFDSAIFDSAIFDTDAAAPGSFLTGWSRRKKHTISSAGELTNRHVVIDVDRISADNQTGSTVYVPVNESRWDFGDIRFTSADGTTELDFWQETGATDLDVVLSITGPGTPGALTANYGLGSVAAIGKLTNAVAGNQILVAWRDPAQVTAPIRGVLYCYDKDGNVLWDYHTADNSPLYTVAIADVNGDGANEVVLCTGSGNDDPVQNIVVLNGATGVEIVYGDLPYQSPYESGYYRSSDIGHFTDPSAVQLGGIDGYNNFLLFDLVAGKPLLAKGNTLVPTPNPQKSVAFDVDGDGLHELLTCWSDGDPFFVADSSRTCSIECYNVTYNEAAASVRNDGGKTYRCIQAHTSGSSTRPSNGADAGKYWNEITYDAGAAEWLTATSYASGGAFTQKWQHDIGNNAHHCREVQVHYIEGIGNCVFYHWLSFNPGSGGWGMVPLDANGDLIPAQAAEYVCSYYRNYESPGPFAVRDFIGDGTKQVGIITGTGPSGGTATAPAISPTGLGEIQIWTPTGNHLLSAPVPSITQGVGVVGTLDTEEVWVLPMHDRTTRLYGNIQAATTARFYVKVPTIAAGTTELYTYWGKSDATSTSDPTGIFDIFYEDFAAVDDWTAQAGGTPAYQKPQLLYAGHGTAKRSGSLDSTGIEAPYSATKLPTLNHVTAWREIAAQSGDYAIEWWQRNDASQVQTTNAVRHRVALRRIDSGTKAVVSPSQDVSLEVKLDLSTTKWVGIKNVAGTTTTAVDNNSTRDKNWRFLTFRVGSTGTTGSIDGAAAAVTHAGLTPDLTYRIDLYGTRRYDGGYNPLMAGAVSQMRAYTTFTPPAPVSWGDSESAPSTGITRSRSRLKLGFRLGF